MRVRLITIGDRAPAWINTGVGEYSKRLPSHWHFEITAIAPAVRTKGNKTDHILGMEAQKIQKALDANAHIIVLDERGAEWTTQALATNLCAWQHEGRPLNFIIGGPDGLAASLKLQAHTQWSLSKLTLPHLFVRLWVTEQLYRAMSLLEGHPYHRA